MRRTTTTLLLVAVLLDCKGRGKKDEQYKTEKADRGNVTMTVTATGTLSAVTTVQVGSQVSGVIAALHADFKSRVKTGQLIAELDPAPLQAQAEQRRADVTRAQVEASNAKINYDRLSRLSSAGLSSQADVDSARAQYQAAAAQVTQAAAALRQAETNVRYTRIVSPIDGVVVDRKYDIGQTVAASFQAPTLFEIAQDLTKMQLQADVDQSDIGRIKVGQVARFTVDAYPEEEFRGRIAQIRYNAQINQNVVTYPVIIEVANPEERLLPKMTANVTIDVATVENVLRVPNAALRFKPSTETAGNAGGGPSGNGGDAMRRAAQTGGGGLAGAARQFPGGRAAAGGGKQQTVYILDTTPEKKLKPVSIRTGITDGRYTQVLSGELHEGDAVVVGLATSKVEGPPPMGGGGGGGGAPRGGNRRG
ncbi:MAG: efflux RND transporter periplasmic adaptor subunit [Acidobacteria bacterium]|nr:efflux RND transporter periplasmic adaptor subunit [Acidobacteriota bacterium]MBV9477132.1 efflux RND transporter periplasmic adaptor subunit [Acidobacteriota bacterium]